LLKASVCIPSYNRREMLLATLRSLDEQTAPADSYEVVVADDGSTDGTVQALEAYRPRYCLRWHRQANAGPAAATNTAARMAKNEVLVFLDADQICTPELIAVHLGVHEREGDVFVQGLYPLAEGYRSRAASLLYERSLFVALAPIERPHPASPYMWSAQVSVRRSTWERVGGFDSAFREYGGEDTDFGLRVAALGVRFLFEPRALSYHLHEISYRSLRNQAFNEGRSIIRLSEKFGIPVETLFGGSVGCGFDRVLVGGWTRVPGVMDVLGRALTSGVIAADAIRIAPAQLLTARIVHRLYKLGGLVAAGYQANGAG